jgi:hypothetical protein
MKGATKAMLMSTWRKQTPVRRMFPSDHSRHFRRKCLVTPAAVARISHSLDAPWLVTPGAGTAGDRLPFRQPGLPGMLSTRTLRSSASCRRDVPKSCFLAAAPMPSAGEHAEFKPTAASLLPSEIRMFAPLLLAPHTRRTVMFRGFIGPAAISAMASISASCSAQAQTWPTRPVTMVVNYDE